MVEQAMHLLRSELKVKPVLHLVQYMLEVHSRQLTIEFWQRVQACRLVWYPTKQLEQLMGEHLRQLG